MGEGTTRPLGPAGAVDAAVDRYADGSGMVMNMLHRRMRLTAQADAMGVELPGGRSSTRRRRCRTPRSTTRCSGNCATSSTSPTTCGRAPAGAARQVKYLKELDRNRAGFEARELDDLGRLLERTPTTLAAGRVELAYGRRDGTVELDDYLLYHWAWLTPTTG